MAETRRMIGVLLRLLVAVALMTLLISHVSLHDIGKALRNANPWWVSTMIPLTLISVWLGAAQLKIFTDCHGMKVSLGRIVHINLSTEFYNLFLPGLVSGGAIRWYRLSRGNQMRAQALTVILVNRLCNLFFLLLLGVVAWLVEGQYQQAQVEFTIMLGGLLTLTLGFMLLMNRRVLRFVCNTMLTSRYLNRFIKEKLEKLVQAVSEYIDLPNQAKYRVAAYMLVWHLIIIVSEYCFVLALSLSVPLSAIIWIRSLVSLLLLLPITISGFGVREGSWVYFLGHYAVAPAEAFALSLLTFSRNLFQAALGVLLELRALFFTRFHTPAP